MREDYSDCYSSNVLLERTLRIPICFNVVYFEVFSEYHSFQKNMVLSTLRRLALVRNVVFAKLQYFCNFSKVVQTSFFSETEKC
jgi:hypothetical protein